MTSRLLKNSTALALVSALCLPVPPTAALAQDTSVDCAATPDDPACAAGAPAEAPLPEPAPAPETVAPDTVTPEAEAPEAEAPEAETPEPEIPEPAASGAPAPEAPAEPAAPAEPVPAAPDAQPDQAPAPEAAPAPADTPSAESAGEALPAEVPADTPPLEEPAEQSAPATPDDAQASPEQEPSEQGAERPAAGAEAPATAPAEKPEAPAVETTPAAKPAAQSTDGDSATAEPGEPVAADAGTAPEEPAAVVEDDASEAQRAEIREREERRRDEARDRRLELLGAAAVGAGIGMLIPALGGKVVEDQGDRLIVERDGEYYVRKDESSLLRYGDDEFRVERLRAGRTRETVTRDDGTRIVTIRDEGGYILYRSRIRPDGREIVMIDNRPENRRDDRRDNRRRRDFDRDLPPVRVGIPRERYIVPAGRSGYDDIYETFAAPPVEAVEEAYTLREIRESERLRDKLRRVDLDTITFDTGSATVRRSQVPLLEEIARASIALIEQDPSTVLLVEGHTDAVGSNVSNLALSDRRAETVARILVEVYGVPAENMVVQGYGEDFLKIDTEGAEERNRRVTLRNITPLLQAGTR
jgi:outer membrane protein OmpA-like peptidoglycan-associated protein